MLVTSRGQNRRNRYVRKTRLGRRLETLDVSNNRIEEVYFDHRTHFISNVDLSNNLLTGQGFENAHVQLPRCDSVDLTGNPIESLDTFSFPPQSPMHRISFRKCSIESLNNVTFVAEEVDLSWNPLRLIRDVKFRNVKTITMQKCGLTLKFLMQIRDEIKVVLDRPWNGGVTWDVVLNSNIRSLDGFVCPKGITKMRVDKRLNNSKNIEKTQSALKSVGCELEFVDSFCGCCICPKCSVM